MIQDAIPDTPSSTDKTISYKSKAAQILERVHTHFHYKSNNSYVQKTHHHLPQFQLPHLADEHSSVAYQTLS